MLGSSLFVQALERKTDFFPGLGNGVGRVPVHVVSALGFDDGNVVGGEVVKTVDETVDFGFEGGYVGGRGCRAFLQGCGGRGFRVPFAVGVWRRG